jgi:nucleotide-binding universal stress UspA family protein
MKKAQARRATRTGYRRILWPTDFSPLAKAALPHALRLAQEGGAELAVVHVLPSTALFAAPEVSGQIWARLEQENRAAGMAELRRVTQQVKAKGPKLRIQSVLAQGVPFDQILRVAKRLRCDLIVIATHGRTGLRHILMGSVAENVVRRAPCPVLTVRSFGLRARS